MGLRGIVIFACEIFVGAWAYGVAAREISRTGLVRFATVRSETGLATLATVTSMTLGPKRSRHSTNLPSINYERPKGAVYEEVK